MPPVAKLYQSGYRVKKFLPLFIALGWALFIGLCLFFIFNTPTTPAAGTGAETIPSRTDSGPQ